MAGWGQLASGGADGAAVLAGAGERGQPHVSRARHHGAGRRASGAGVAPERLGSPVGALAGAPLPRPVREGQRLRGEILHVDHFGNAITNIRREHVSEPGGALRVDIGCHSLCGPVESYAGAGVGEPLVIWGSAGFLEVAVREGSAAAVLGIGRGDAVLVRTG